MCDREAKSLAFILKTKFKLFKKVNQLKHDAFKYFND